MDIRTLCLGILTFRDATGYDVKKRLEGPLRHYYDASFGSIYPALAGLKRDGLVERVEESQEKRPHKKVYSITQAGRLALVEALLEDPRPDRYRSDFMVTVPLRGPAAPGTPRCPARRPHPALSVLCRQDRIEARRPVAGPGVRQRTGPRHLQRSPGLSRGTPAVARGAITQGTGRGGGMTRSPGSTQLEAGESLR